MENLSKLFQKQKRKKNMKRLSFKNQPKIEFLLTFTGCRKVLGKMPKCAFIEKYLKRFSGSLVGRYLSPTWFYLQSLLELLSCIWLGMLTLKHTVSNLPTNCLSVFDHFVILALKGLMLKIYLTVKIYFF